MHTRRQRKPARRMVLATAAVEDREIRHLGVEQEFIRAPIDSEVHIELPDNVEIFPGAVGRLNKALYGTVQGARCWNRELSKSLGTRRFEQSKADPCVLRKVVDGEAVVVIVVHVDDLLVCHPKDEEEMEQFVKDLSELFAIKDLGEASDYMGCHISRDNEEMVWITPKDHQHQS